MTPDPDLSDTFGTSAVQRRAQLGGLLPRRSPTPPTAGQEPAAPEARAVAEPAPAPSAPAPTGSQPQPGPTPPTATPPRVAPATEQRTQPVSVYVRPAAAEAARRRRRRQRGITHADIALDAIETHRDDLAALVAHRHSTPVRAAGALFPARSAGRRRNDGRPRVLWTVFLTTAEIQVIDRLATETGAVSRSELISVAVEAEMGV